MPDHVSLQLVPLVPPWLAALLAAGLAAVVALGSRELAAKGVPPRWVAAFAALRGLAVLLFLLALLGPAVRYAVTAAVEPGVLVLVDASRSMAQPSADGGTRLDEVRRALAAGPDRRARWYAFDRTATPLGRGDLAALAATGEDTRYAEALEAAWADARAAGDGPAPRRVLLASDGHDAGPGDVVEAARKFGVAVDVVAPRQAGGPGGGPARITGVQSAGRVLLGAETHFQVTVRAEGGPERRLTLELLDGGKPAQAVPVTVGGGRAEATVRVPHRPAAAGTMACEFRLAGDGASAEPYRLSVPVLDGRFDVLVLEDAWRWDFKYLRRVLEDDPAFRMTAFLSRGGGAFAQFAEPDRRSRLAAFPQGRDQLAGFDAFVLGDVNPKRWPKGLAAAVRQEVVEAGKPLVVMAGPNLSHWAESPELLQLLPVELGRETAEPRGGPVAVRPTAEGAAGAFFLRPGGGPAALPAFDHVYAPVRKKPAAAVLLEAAGLANAYGPLIVMAEHTAGRGRVLYVGTDTLWKWQAQGPEDAEGRTAYRAFWQQALRAVAGSRQSGAGAAVWLTPERSRVEAGRPVRVRVELESPNELPAAPELRAAVSGPDGRSLPVPLTPAGPHAWSAELALPSAGPHRLTATTTVEGRPVASGEVAIDADEPRGESDGGAVDAANLARIAAATGGRVIDPADPAGWPPAGEAEAVRQERTLDLWNGGTLLVLLVGVLGIDWLLRLLRGYV